MNLPTARFTSRRGIQALAIIPVTIAVIWGVYHVASVAAGVQGYGSPMALTFFVTFLLLWWVPLSWMERPFTATRRQQHQLDELSVTVHVPVYNEDPATLRTALWSLLNQTRRPNRIHVVEDGPHTEVRAAYDHLEVEIRSAAAQRDIGLRWVRSPVNRGKRHAQMATLADDDYNIYVTLDSDSTLDRAAIAEGLKPFADPEVMSVAGMVVVWNSRSNFLTRLTCMLYTPFTRGFRAAQSKLGRVMVNSGTLAFYRAPIVREYAGSYENERFAGRPMQMNDDSMLTFYAMLAGRTVHQPSSIALTLVPDQMGHYLNQQLRWMRGTFIRTLWWWKYLSPRDFAWWMPVFEMVQLLLSIVAIPVVLMVSPDTYDWKQLLLATATVGVALNYLCALRYFVIERSDESGWTQFTTFLLAPVAGMWRFFILRPMIMFAMATFWKVGRWGTRSKVEVSLAAVTS